MALSFFSQRIDNIKPPNATKAWGSWPQASSVLIAGVGSMLVLSLLMIASASIPYALKNGVAELHFFYRQLIYIAIGSVAAFMVYKINMKHLFSRASINAMLIITALLLLYTCIFGTEINGAKRWIELGFINFQVAELAKLVAILYVSNFMVERAFEVRSGIDGLIRISVALVALTFLLLFQPDFGSLAVILGMVFVMFLIAGMPLRLMAFLGALLTAVVALMVVFAEYRLKRAMSFWDPFDDVQDSDYQLARSLIAFGRGEITGVGYGDSVQKLSHLPEAHTDFLLAITGEELGFVGVLLLFLLQALIIGATLRISHVALQKGQLRLCYTAFGIGMIFLAQFLINAGMNMGMLPTKGLTMPFFSYGGSSIVISLVMVGLLLNIYKNRTIDDDQLRRYL